MDDLHSCIKKIELSCSGDIRHLELLIQLEIKLHFDLSNMYISLLS